MEKQLKQDKNTMYRNLFNIKDDSTIEQEIEEWTSDLKETDLKTVLLQALGVNENLSVTIPNLILSDTFNIHSRTFKNPYNYNQKEEIIIEQNSNKKVHMIIAQNSDINYKQTIEHISELLATEEDFDSFSISFNIRYQEAKNILFYINFLKPLKLKVNC